MTLQHGDIVVIPGYNDDKPCKVRTIGKRGPDKKPRKRKKSAKRVILNLSLTPENAEFIRMYPSSNSKLVNKLIETYRDDITGKIAPCT